MSSSALDPRRAPELACVVLAVGAPRELPRAVRSLVEQSEPAEILVVNSGGGDAAEQLHAAGLTVAVLHSPNRLLPGATRNAGVRATTAPYVAFLAADCIAEPGWVTARLHAHRSGADAVASAVINASPRRLAAWASYVALFNRRMPGTPPLVALRYGVSYRRTLLASCGGFREDLRTGEDTELHARLPRSCEIAWVPAVRTAHRHPETLSALLADQFTRGRRSASAWRSLDGPRPRTIAVNAVTRLPGGALRALRAAPPGERRWIAAACLILPAAAIAYAFGALRGSPPADPE